MGEAMQSCINSIWSGICLISQSLIVHIFDMNPWGIVYNNTDLDVSKRSLTCLSCLHRHIQSNSLASRSFREVTIPFDILLPRCFMQHVITEKLLEKSECQPEYFALKNNRAQREKGTEMRYSLSWLQLYKRAPGKPRIYGSKSCVYASILNF